MKQRPEFPGDILAHLAASGVPYEHLRHERLASRAAAAQTRGVSEEALVKTLLIRVGGELGLYAIAMGERLDNRAIRQHHGARKAHFISADELLRHTGLAPGTVPPIGRPVLPFPLYADPSVLRLEPITFGAGTRTDSIRLSAEAWRQLAQPQIFPFARPPG